MEFWGVEVKNGESLKVDPGDDKIIHLSNACMGDVTKDIGGGPVALYVKFGNQKFVLGTLSSDKFPQISYDLVFEKEFELSHNWKYGSVFFTGFKAQPQSESYPFLILFYIDIRTHFLLTVTNAFYNILSHICILRVLDFILLLSLLMMMKILMILMKIFQLVQSMVICPSYVVGVKPDANEAKQKKIADPRKRDANGEDDDSSESDSDDDSSEDKPTANGDIESSEGDDDSDDDEEEEGDDESDEETAKKIEASNKRGIESSKKTPVPVKKTKFVTPQKTDSKNVVHAATPHPSKQAGKATANNKLQSPKSGGDYSCKPCNRLFKTEDALSSHNKAKHSAK
ncbi:Histone deacetylase HDT3 [Glycine max]|nr:Histone deacetylase HDT3 [Glycine max]